jgi:TPR repeat protein
MARTRILGALGVDADGSATIDTHEPIERLPLPTLDERASVYLRAIHGDRDFTSAEHVNARDLILEAMAAGIAARGVTTRDITTRDITAIDVTTSDVATSDVAARSDSNAPNAVLQDLEPIMVPGLVGDQDIDRSDDEPQDTALARQSPAASQRPRMSLLGEGRIFYGIAAVCSAAIFAAVLGYWVGTVSQTSRSTPDNSRLAVQAPPADPSGQMPAGSDPRVVAEAQRELASVLNVARPGPDEVAALLKQGRELVALGRFRFARMLLEQAAEAKNASAAFAIGQTYDPLIERSAARPDAPPDLAMARVWYEKAKDLGSAEAAQRLSLLPAATPVPTPRPR